MDERVGRGSVGSAAPILFAIFNRLGAGPWFRTPEADLLEVQVCASDGYLSRDGCVVRTELAPVPGLAPNAPLRESLALWTQADNDPQTRAGEFTDAFCTPPSIPVPLASDPQPDRAPASATQWRWAALLARLFECFPLICLHCNQPMRIISFITDPIPIKAILSHLSSLASGSSDIPVRLSPHAKPSSSAFHRLLPLPSCSSITHHTIRGRSNS